MHSPSTPKLPPPLPPAPTLEAPQLEEARRAEMEELKKRKGYMATIMTKPGGLGLPSLEKTRALG